MTNMFNPYQFNFQPQPQTQQLIRVSGMDGAKAYQMGANSSVALFHENDDVFYIKSTDGAGFPTIHAYRFEPISDEQPKSEQYVTVEMFEQFKKELRGKENRNGK